jgi:carboxyl-terminal processing protease
MKLTKLIKLTILFSFTVNYAQSNNESYYNNLFYTCKVWGYLKYFHTSLAEGKINWDDVLLNNLPNLKSVNSKQEFNDYLNIYFNRVGEMQTPATPPPIVSDDLSYNLNTDWFINDSFSSNTTSFLQDIQNKFRPRSNYYVQALSGASNPSFEFDDLYYVLLNTTEEYRSLGLFRYWNIINYFFPYKNLLDKNWDDVLKEVIPKIINCQDDKSYYYTILELAANINDAHAFTSSAVISRDIKGYYYLPLKLKYIDSTTVISDVGMGVSDLKPGDIIKKINGVPIEELRNNLRLITNGSNPASLERNVNSDLVSFVDTSEPVKLEIENENGSLEVLLPLIYYADYQNSFKKNEFAWTIKIKHDKKFGVIDMGILTVNQIPTMFTELWETDALIFDIRNYPNGTMWYMINYLFPGPIMVARFTTPDATYPGTLYWTDATVGTGDFTKNYTNRIYILFNEATQSQAEYTIMAIEQHPMAIKIGSQTAGADGNVSKMYLPGQITAYFTGLGTFYPDYKPTQRIGIITDVSVVPTIQGIRDGKDEVMEAAFNHYLGINSVEQENIIPADYSLSQNFPNPFNPTTSISFSIPQAAFVTLRVYDVVGQEVTTLVNEFQQPGNFVKTFHGTSLPSSVYFYRIQVYPANSGTGNFIETKKMLLLK